MNQIRHYYVSVLLGAVTLSSAIGGPIAEAWEVQILSRLKNKVEKVEFADFDADGDLDLLATSWVPGGRRLALVWYPNRGDGVVDEARLIGTFEDGIRSIQMVDLNGDGGEDLIVGTPRAVLVGFRRGETIGDMIVVLKAESILQVTAGDLDGDGDPDLAAIGRPQSQWLANDGTGMFSDRGQLDPEAIIKPAPVDFDGDGHGDLLVNEWDLEAQLRLSRGTENGEFARHEVIFRWMHLSNFVIGDMDDDGDTDVVVGASDVDVGSLVVLENNGFGGFFNKHLIDSCPGFLKQVAVDDVDGDGDRDIVVLRSDFTHGRSGADNKQRLQIFRNEGNFTFEGVEEVQESGWLGQDAQDIDGDGDLDVLAVDLNKTTGGGQVVGFENAGAEGFSREPRSLFLSDRELDRVLFADITGDGLPDSITITGDLDRSRIDWRRNLGNWKMAEPQNIDFDESVMRVSNLRAADISGDGILDLLWLGRVLTIRLGLGDGNFAEPIELDENGRFQIVDFDGDGDSDIVISGSSNETPPDLVRFAPMMTPVHSDPNNSFATWTVNTYVLSNAGDGTFGERRGLLSVYGDGVSILIDDVDGNGLNDIVIDQFASSFKDGADAIVDVLHQLPGGKWRTLGARSVLPRQGYDTEFNWILRDLNGDQSKEFIGLIGDQTFWAPFVDGAAGSPVCLGESAYLSPIVSGDLNGDGLVDMVAGDNGELSVYLNPGVTQSEVVTIEVWRQRHFGSPLNEGNAGDNSDPDDDGLENLLEYALGLDPLDDNLAVKTAALPAPVVLESGSKPVAFRFEIPRTMQPDVMCVLEQSSSLADDSWILLASRAGVGPWITNWARPRAHVVSLPNGRLEVSIPYEAHRFAPSTFVRLRVERLEKPGESTSPPF